MARSTVDASDARTTEPVLERAREWILATPSPSRDNWTGPVFPARELGRSKSPAKVGGPTNVELHVGSPPPSATDTPNRRPILAAKVVAGGPSFPASVAPPPVFQMTYGGEGLRPHVPIFRDRGGLLPPGCVPGRPVASSVSPSRSTFDRQMLTAAAVCSFADNSLSKHQYMAKRVRASTFIGLHATNTASNKT